MSINFNKPINEEASAFIQEMFGEPEAEDGKSFLFNDLNHISGRHISQLTDKAGQPMTLKMHKMGDIKKMADGTRYEVTPDGWRKIDE